MTTVTAAVLTAALAGAPGADGPSPAEPACDPTPPGIGPRSAAIRVRAYLDPVAPGALATYLELRRLVAERGGTLAVDVVLVASPGVRDPHSERVRGWAEAMGRRDRLVAALRVLAREGPDRIHARLATRHERAALAALVDLPPAEHEKAVGSSCPDELVWRQTRALEQRLSHRGTAVFRLPVFGVDDVMFEDGTSLDKLRPELGRSRYRERQRELRPPATVPEARAISSRLERPALRGALLGGRGLPHRFVLMARAEDDPNLVMLLPPVLEYRRDHPGELTVQVVARGSSLGADRLRHRLCAARLRGMVVHYVRWLATEPSARQGVAERDLLRELDQVPEKRCRDEPDPAAMGLPDGGWLDGLPRTRSELEALPTTLRLLEAAHRPLTDLLAPPMEEP